MACTLVVPYLVVCPELYCDLIANILLKVVKIRWDLLQYPLTCRSDQITKRRAKERERKKERKKEANNRTTKHPTSRAEQCVSTTHQQQ
jgi:hypothetical protein